MQLKRRSVLGLAAGMLAAPWSVASPAKPLAGVEYIQLPAPMPVRAAAGKIEVIEFFMYHCPACNALEAELMAWVKKMGDKIEFRRFHLPYHGVNDPEAHLFVTLEAMGLDRKLHQKVLDAWHVERKRLRTDDDNVAFVVANGIDRQKFLDVYNSFSVQATMRRLPRTLDQYAVQYTPSFVIDGRFLTSPSMIAQANLNLAKDDVHPASFTAMEALIDLAIRSKKAG